MTQRLEAQGNKNSNSRYAWDDGSDHDDVANIFVRGDARGIQYIWLDYLKSGKLGAGLTQPCLTGPGFAQTFRINHLNDEQLESVEGYYDPKLGCIQGLQFRTNLRISELIGFEKDCTKFTLAVSGKKIVGFHGFTTINLESLGAYVTWISPTRLEAKGGKGGKAWNDGADHEGVTNIYVRGGSEGIQHIKFDYIKNGKHVYGPDHGVKGRGFTEQFEINHLNEEYLVSVECYYNSSKSEAIQGIQFKTNIKTSDLIGYDDGIKFILAANGKKIIGFHGYAEKNLNSLGAYFTASPITKLECKGLTGNSNIWDDGAFEGVRKVYVMYDAFVWLVTFYYDNGGEIKRLQHGSMEGKEGKFEVDYPNEFITSVEGTLKTSGSLSVASLTFKTSKGRTSPTFGNATNSKFVLESKGCALVGFHGRSNVCLDAIGAYFRPLPPPPDAEKVEAKGGDGGASWDDGGTFNGVRKIFVGVNEHGVAFVKFMYYKSGRMVYGDDHGNKTLLFDVHEFELELISEIILSVEGCYDDKSGVITMLRFKTNKKMSTDFGLATSSTFELRKDDHQIVGFHGKSSNMLHQIGVHFLPENFKFIV